MPFVLDASVALAWCFEDEATPATDGLLHDLSDGTALAPSLWAFEVANAFTVAQRRERISEAKVQLFAATLQALPIHIAPPRPIAAITALAFAHGLSAYDAAYLDLAEQSGLPLAALDGRLRRAAAAAGVVVLPT